MHVFSDVENVLKVELGLIQELDIHLTTILNMLIRREQATEEQHEQSGEQTFS